MILQAILLLSGVGLAAGEGQPDPWNLGPCSAIGPGVARRAEAVRREVAWERDAVLVADINCDGIEDYGISGTVDSTSYHVAVVVGPLSDSSRVSVIGFHLAPWAQNGLGGWPAYLELERIDYDLEAVLEGPVEGFQRSARCRGLLISAGMIDPFHVYWNHKTGELAWWRL